MRPRPSCHAHAPCVHARADRSGLAALRRLLQAGQTGRKSDGSNDRSGSLHGDGAYRGQVQQETVTPLAIGPPTFADPPPRARDHGAGRRVRLACGRCEDRNVERERSAGSPRPARRLGGARAAGHPVPAGDQGDAGPDTRAAHDALRLLELLARWSEGLLRRESPRAASAGAVPARVRPSGVRQRVPHRRGDGCRRALRVDLRPEWRQGLRSQDALLEGALDVDGSPPRGRRAAGHRRRPQRRADRCRSAPRSRRG